MQYIYIISNDSKGGPESRKKESVLGYVCVCRSYQLGEN